MSFMSSIPNLSPQEVAETRATFARLKEVSKLGGWEERHARLWMNAENIRRYLYSFEIVGSDSSFIKAYVDDAMARFFHTIDLLEGKTSGKVLEIGANPYLLTILLKNLTDFEITPTNFFSLSVYDTEVNSGRQEVRSVLFGEEYIFDYLTLNVELSKYPFEDGEFDTILFCEVLEHIIVDPIKCFGKLRQALRPGGQLVLTTPNAVRLINFAHMIAGKNFFDRYHPQNGIYGRHNREFTLSEVTRLLEFEGFKIKIAKTLDRYNYDVVEMFVDSYDEQTKLKWSGSQLRDMLASLDAETRHRGDNIYVVAERV
jgi:SAM-dependent methyltransferase